MAYRNRGRHKDGRRSHRQRSDRRDGRRTTSARITAGGRTATAGCRATTAPMAGIVAIAPAAGSQHDQSHNKQRADTAENHGSLSSLPGGDAATRTWSQGRRPSPSQGPSFLGEYNLRGHGMVRSAQSADGDRPDTGAALSAQGYQPGDDRLGPFQEYAPAGRTSNTAIHP